MNRILLDSKTNTIRNYRLNYNLINLKFFKNLRKTSSDKRYYVFPNN